MKQAKTSLEDALKFEKDDRAEAVKRVFNSIVNRIWRKADKVLRFSFCHAEKRLLYDCTFLMREWQNHLGL